MCAPSWKVGEKFEKAPRGDEEPSDSPGGLQTPEFDLQKLDLRVHAQLVLLQTEYVRMKGCAAGGILGQEQLPNSGFGTGLLEPESVDFLFEGINLL
jgi:hypothetical protein